MNGNSKTMRLELCDQYQLGELLGKGAFGSVYKAIQKRTGQIVAVKILTLAEEIATAPPNVQLARFDREAKLCAELNHPNIVRLIDKIHNEKNQICIVFEYVPGTTLQKTIKKQGALQPTEAGEIMGQILTAIIHAHEHNIVHRDLKPANIIVTSSSTGPWAKVLDFGLSALLSGARPNDYQSLTLASEILGTPAYCAPEQLRGEPVGITADLYAWALIFVECLTGHPVITGESTAEIFHNQLSPKEIVLPAAIAGHPIGALLRQVLKKDRDERLSDPVELWNSFRRIRLDDLVGNLHDHLEVASGDSRQNRKEQASLDQKRQVTLLCCLFRVLEIPHSGPELEALEKAQSDLSVMCVETTEQCGGHVIGSLGEETVVCFGYPHVTDADARRAARMVLELLHKKKQYEKIFSQHGIEIQLKIAIHTGMAAIRFDNLECSQILGKARALLNHAAPNTALASDSARRLLEPFLVFEKLNLPGPAESFQLVGEYPTQPFGFMPVRKFLHSFIGREPEMEIIKQARAKLAEGKGGSILLMGDPGIGKSRLVHEAVEKERKKGTRTEVLRCFPEHRNNPLYPVVQFLRQKLAIPARDATENDLQRILKVLGTIECRTQEVVPVFFTWFSLPLPGGYGPSPLSSGRQKKILLETLAKLMSKLTDEAWLFILEDLHWADPTTLEWLDVFLALTQDNKFSILTARPEFSPEKLHGGTRVYSLGGLTRKHSVAIVSQILGDTGVNSELIDQVIERADGVPLFLEEVAASLLEASDDMERFNIPVTLRELLVSRIDRLGAARATLQIAAAIGREFDHSLLLAVSTSDESSLSSDLNLLLDSGIIYQKQDIRFNTYAFRHALLRDAAYDGLLESTQRKIHAKIAHELENQKDIGYEAATLAQHYAAAGQYRKAAKIAVVAASDAVRISLYDEAITLGQLVKEWLAMASETDPEVELTANSVLTQAMMDKYGWTNERVRTMAEQSRMLLKHVPRDEFVIGNMWALITYHHVAGNRRDVQDLLKDLFQAVHEVGSTRYLSIAETLKGVACWIDGNYPEGRLALQRAIDLYDPANDSENCRLLGFDNRVWAAAGLSNALWFSSNRQDAQNYAHQAVVWARELNHAPSLGIAYLYLALVYHYDNNVAETKYVSGQLLALAGKYGLPAVEGYAAILNSWATGDIERALATLAALRSLGCKLGLTHYDSTAAQLYAGKGQLDEALEVIKASLAMCEDDGEHYYEPELYRLRGAILSMDPSNNEQKFEAYRKAAQSARNYDMHRIEALSLSALAGTSHEIAGDRERLKYLSNLDPDLLESNPYFFL